MEAVGGAAVNSSVYPRALSFMFILVSKVGRFLELYGLPPHVRGPDYFKPFPPGGKVGIITLIVRGFFWMPPKNLTLAGC